MPKDIVAQRKITFAVSPPMGIRGTFTHDGELWIAYPAKKNTQILTIIDRLLGIHAEISTEMMRWINLRPTDAELITRILERTSRARKLQHELTIEKTEATTQ